MTDKHTPGQWQSLRTTVFVPAGAGRCVIADCGTYADARLMAAAPDMLAALQIVAELFNYSDNEALTYAINNARDVLAKVMGPQS